MWLLHLLLPLLKLQKDLLFPQWKRLLKILCWYHTCLNQQIGKLANKVTIFHKHYCQSHSSAIKSTRTRRGGRIGLWAAQSILFPCPSSQILWGWINFQSHMDICVINKYIWIIKVKCMNHLYNYIFVNMDYNSIIIIWFVKHASLMLASKLSIKGHTFNGIKRNTFSYDNLSASWQADMQQLCYVYVYNVVDIIFNISLTT